MVSHARPFYYLENFCYALAWLKGRYTDLMRAEELAFVDAMERLPQQSAALLVRMIMRRGEFFRTSKLHYAEIGSTESAAASLVELAWVDPRPPLSLQQLCALLRRDELQVAFSLRRPPRLTSKRSPQQLPLDFSEDESRTLERWWRDAPDQVLHVRVTGVCERLRLMFFGNFHQDWSAFVLSDLGIQRYETVPLDGRARAFQTREQIDHFESLYRLRELVHAEAPAEAVLAGMPPSLPNCDWIEAQRSRLLFHIGQQSERARDLPRAIRAYRSCALAEARVRTIRVLERMGHADEASALLTASEASSASELERQHAARIRPRLMRRLGLQAPRPTIERGWSSFELELAAPDPPCAVERVVRDHLQSEDSPVFYVESGLINSLFGLLFWDAIFAPVSGAFFHPFQAAPADLHEPDFQARRACELDACFAQLESGDYRATILDHFERKAGVASPFVAWGLVSRELLTLALTCVPAAHLRELFGRLLCDLRANRAGLPDLIQLWPREQRYRMVEVKGPGDRLQDNQVRWLTFCATKGIPAEVCSVRWAS